jgi:hypothetical protein
MQRYWWVNQNQTYRHEVQGGYLWSPKRNANGARNPFYESMREVAPGDLIFSFMDTRILALRPFNPLRAAEVGTKNSIPCQTRRSGRSRRPSKRRLFHRNC